MSEFVERLNASGGILWKKSASYKESVGDRDATLYYVYRIHLVCNQKSYIGFSSDPSRRVDEHVASARYTCNQSHGTKFKKAIRKHGIDSFCFEILFVSDSRDSALEKESELISSYDSYKNGYNSTCGGEGRSGEVLSPEFIVCRALEFFDKNGKPPPVKNGLVEGGYPGDTWCGYDFCLRNGYRGLPKLGSLAKLLSERCGFKYQCDIPDLCEESILSLAELYKEKHSKWPGQKSGPVEGGYPGDTWAVYELHLRDGGRGLPGGSSVAKLISSKHEHAHAKNRPELTYDFIIARASEYFDANSKYPAVRSGSVPGGHTGDTWFCYDQALREGLRGLPGGTSLKALFAERLGAVDHLRKPTLAFEHIVDLARQHKSLRGSRPSCASGDVLGGHPGDTWRGYDQALKNGSRGLPKGKSLSKLLDEYGV